MHFIMLCIYVCVCVCVGVGGWGGGGARGGYMLYDVVSFANEGFPKTHSKYALHVV